MRTYDRFYCAMNPLIRFFNKHTSPHIQPTSWIIGVFSWSASDQGQNYWKSLHDKWYEKMKNVDIINEKT